MLHTAECQRQCAERTAAREAWVAQWPNHCKTCQGAGAQYSTYDPSPSGVSLGSGQMVDVDVCPDCAEKGICSRCGQVMFDPETLFARFEVVCHRALMEAAFGFCELW